MRELAYCSRSEDFGHNKVVVKDSRRNEWLWFIVKVATVLESSTTRQSTLQSTQSTGMMILKHVTAFSNLKRREHAKC